MQQKRFLEKGGSLQLDTFGIFIIVVLACVVLGTVGVLFASRRGEPEVKRHVADLAAMKGAAEKMFAVSPDIKPGVLSLKDLGVQLEHPLETSHYSLGILSEDQGAKLFVGVKIFSDPGVEEISEKYPRDLGELFWAGEIGSAPGRNGGELQEPLYSVKEHPRKRSPQWIYLLVREVPRQ
ncbi:MAG TPA: hypothetical protein PK364_09980 [Synergistaceae bacterium]|nr:hypothetical protein [Synergistaceae bacterium]HPQ37915.1 hypothetical protein [Synergistaceae bacterium]